jgi:glycosyltransferase involved in cell wall biosynthesis
MKLSICICTYNRNQSLINCIKSINKILNKKKIKINIIINDNSLNNNLSTIKKKLIKISRYNIIFAIEKKRGIVHARNKCLKIVRRKRPNYVAFIDDDCVVDKNWLKNILFLIDKLNADVITGPQKYERKTSISSNNFSKIFEKKYTNNLRRVKWAASNNVFFKCNILHELKNFNFDKNLNKFGIGEDQLFFSIINKFGYKIYWSKNVYVTEKMHSHRININWVKERSKRLGILGHYLDMKLYGKFTGYLFNYLKSFYFLLLSILHFFNFLNLNRKLNSINFFFRFYGKIIGPFKFKKIKFLR